MKHSLLVIDDELDNTFTPGETPRRSSYKQLEPHFDLIFLEEIADLDDVLERSKVDAVLMDFVLSGWGTTVEAILPRISPDLPVGLISNHWGPNFERLRIVLDEHEISRLFTWDDILDASKRHLISFWMQSAIRKKQNLSSVLLRPDEDITILQVSDIQFGSQQPENFAVETELAAQAITQRWRRGPSFIAVTGDIAESAAPHEYQDAAAWLRSFARKLDPNWDDRRFLTVPGNHDVCWPLGWSSRIDLKAKTLSAEPGHLHPHFKAYAHAPYREFSRGLLGSDIWAEGGHYWTDGRYRHEGVVLFGYDTSEDLDDWCNPSQRLVDGSLSRMFGAVRKQLLASPEALVIGLQHHPLIGDPDEIVRNVEAFRKSAQNLGTVVVLSGHAHGEECAFQDYEGGSVLQVTASTVTKLQEKRPENTLRGFNMIELRRSRGRVQEVSVRSCRFEQHAISDNKVVTFVRGEHGDLRRQYPSTGRPA